MPVKEPTWTDERLERLKIGFAAGWTCRQIADGIGVSRNAVIGKLNRLNLTRENSGEVPGPPRKKAPKGRRRGSTPGLQYRLLQAVYAGPQSEPCEAPISTQHICSLLELSEARCRWPINTPGEKDFGFCGNTPLEGLPYCAGHSRIAYRPGSRQRVARG
jgi:GcrA cell cycle regulator